MWCKKLPWFTGDTVLTLPCPAPAFEAVDYVNYDFKNDFGQNGLYMGPPTNELEERWKDLVPRESTLLRENVNRAKAEKARSSCCTNTARQTPPP